MKYKYLKINKSQIFLSPSKDVRTVYIDILIKAGSLYEKKEKWGSFHFLEHLMFDGSKIFPDKQSLENFKEEFGININGSTYGEKMEFWFRFPDINIDQGLKFFEDFIFNSLISFKKKERELSVINQEINDYWNNPSNRFSHKIKENLFGKNHIFTNNNLGQTNTLKKITQRELISLYHRFFQPQNMIIGITGNFDLKTMSSKITAIIKKYKNTKSIKLIIPETKPVKKIIKHKDDVQQSQVVITWPTKRFEIKEYLTLRIINFIIGGNSNSLLFQEIRNKLGLVYNIKSNIVSWPNTNSPEIFASVETKNVNMLIEKIKEITENLSKTGISEEKLQKTKNYINIQTLMGSDTIYHICENNVFNIFRYQKLITPEDFIKIAKEITLEEINQMIKKVFNWNNAYINIMSPKTKNN